MYLRFKPFTIYPKYATTFRSAYHEIFSLQDTNTTSAIDQGILLVKVIWVVTSDNSYAMQSVFDIDHFLKVILASF